MKASVSVIVPVYNREDHIRRAINSLLVQDFEYAYEIIVIDDGSTDKTKSVVHAIDDPKIKYFYQNNKGASAARRKGILEASAEMVCFLDSDDIAKPNYLSSLWNGLQSESNAILAYGLAAEIDGSRLKNESLPPVNENGVLEDPLSALLEFGCFTVSMNLMTSRTTALFATEKREHVLASNDYDFCLRSSLFGKFLFVEVVTILVKRLDDGISGSLGHKQAGFALINACAAVEESCRRDFKIQNLLKHRVKTLWPSAAAQLLYKKEFLLFLKVIFVSLKFISLNDLKKFYWGLRYHAPKR